MIGLAIVAVAVGSDTLIARYLRARAEEEHDVEAMGTSEAAMIDETAGVRRRRRMSRAQRRAANTAISH